MNSAKINHSDLRRREIFLKTQTQKKKREFRISPGISRLMKNTIYFLVLIFLLYFIIFSPIFRVKDIEAEGIETVEIYDRIALDMIGKNIFFINISGYLKKITNDFPVIEQARVVRGLPSTLRVEIKERDAALIWCGKKCFEIDNRGLAYREVEGSIERVFVKDKSDIEINMGDKIVSQKFVEFYQKSVEELERLGVGVGEAFVEDTTFKLTFKTNKNYLIIFDTSSPLENQIYALEQIIASDNGDINEYVDLRVEGLGYIK